MWLGYANDATNFPHKLLLTNRQVANSPKSFENELSVNLELTKTKTSKIIQSSGFFDRLLVQLTNVASPF